MSQDQDARIQYVPLSEVQRWPRNPKLHNLDQLGKSVERFGFVQPLLIDERTGRLVAGHGRTDTLQALKAAGKEPPARVGVDKATGEWLVPVIRGVAFDSDAEAEAYIIADNRLVEIGGWDDAALATILSDLGDGGHKGIGFTPDEAFALLAKLPQLPDAIEFKEFGESVELEVEMIECPACRHKFPR